jgi:transposase-like protein
MAWFSQMAPRIYITCPRCGSSTALVTYQRVESQSCFCPDCQNLWQTRVTRTVAQAPPL